MLQVSFEDLTDEIAHATLQDGSDLWLVSCDEGVSLHTLMYSPHDDGVHTPGGPQILEPSPWWWGLRRGGARGEAQLRGLLRQTLLALQVLHAANVTHRCEQLHTGCVPLA